MATSSHQRPLACLQHKRQLCNTAVSVFGLVLGKAVSTPAKAVYIFIALLCHSPCHMQSFKAEDQDVAELLQKFRCHDQQRLARLSIVVLKVTMANRILFCLYLYCY